ncbi:MAG: ArsR family transcriptional regulator, partial [Actinobacteria bacterium]|nr:ArsR family transcriptional regulator [Actinomycetota bacterium]
MQPLRDATPATTDMFKAMAHPLRIRILELIGSTPMTASMLAERTGESTGSTSYHLR